MSTSTLVPLWLAAAQEACATQHHPGGVLYVVATPIGNRADITLRALHVLSIADAVACEDTRKSGALLQSLGLHKPLLAVHEHNEREAAGAVIERLRAGQRVALVSDAGTPAVSDPGAALVQAVQTAGLPCVPLPGPSSALAALSVAGDAQAAGMAGLRDGLRGGFRFVGFLPNSGGPRSQALRELAAEPGTVLIFEAPHRIETLARELAQELGSRRVTLCRELTKQFETVHTDAASAMPLWLAGDENRRRGEFVIVVHAQQPKPGIDESEAIDSKSEHTLQLLLAELPLKQAVALAAAISGTSRKLLYARALVLKNSAHDKPSEDGLS